MCSLVTFPPRSLVSADSPGNFWEVLGSTIPENTRIISGMLNVYSKTKIKCTEKNEVFSQKQQKRAAKFSLLHCNYLPISVRARENTSCTKAHIFPGKNMTIFLPPTLLLLPLLVIKVISRTVTKM